MPISRTTEGPAVVLALSGAFTGGDETVRLREAILHEAARGNLRLVVDFTDCPMMNSSGIAVLVEAYRIYSERSGSIRLCALKARLANQLAIVRLFDLLPRHESVADAIGAFGPVA
jgi:anti-anti-sigma factor